MTGTRLPCSPARPAGDGAESAAGDSRSRLSIDDGSIPCQRRCALGRDSRREAREPCRTLAHIDARALARGTYASGGRVRQHLAADELYLANLAVDLRGLALSERRARWGPQRVLLTNARLARWCIGRIDEESKWLRSLVPDRFKGIAADDIRAYFEWLEKLRSRQSSAVSSKLRSVGGN